MCTCQRENPHDNAKGVMDKGTAVNFEQSERETNKERRTRLKRGSRNDSILPPAVQGKVREIIVKDY